MAKAKPYLNLPSKKRLTYRQFTALLVEFNLSPPDFFDPWGINSYYFEVRAKKWPNKIVPRIVENILKLTVFTTDAKRLTMIEHHINQMGSKLEYEIMKRLGMIEEPVKINAGKLEKIARKYYSEMTLRQARKLLLLRMISEGIRSVQNNKGSSH